MRKQFHLGARKVKQTKVLPTWRTPLLTTPCQTGIAHPAQAIPTVGEARHHNGWHPAWICGWSTIAVFIGIGVLKKIHNVLRLHATAAPRHVFSSMHLSAIDVVHERSCGFSQEWLCRPDSVYIHIPFCRKRCYYCDFTVKVVGENVGVRERAIAAYLPPLIDEIVSTMKLLRLTQNLGGSSPTSPSSALASLYFGGGTPSLMGPEDLLLIVNTIREHVGVLRTEGDFSGLPLLAFSPTPISCALRQQASKQMSTVGFTEVTLEADPGTFDLNKLRALVSKGCVTRISLGVQSVHDDILLQAGRQHVHADTLRAIEAIQSVVKEDSSLKSFSVDLIAGLPGLTTAGWQEQLNQAIALRPHHISVYDLQLETGTPFWRWYTRDTSRTPSNPLPAEDSVVEMWESASSVLSAAGFRHYELSNYGMRGHESVHNAQYWNRSPFLAFGIGATSHFAGVRFKRPKRMTEYTKWVAQLKQVADLLERDFAGIVPNEGLATAAELQRFWTAVFGASPLLPTHLEPSILTQVTLAAELLWSQQSNPTSFECQADTAWDECVEHVMLALRTDEGLDLRYFQRVFGRAVSTKLIKSLEKWTHPPVPHVTFGLSEDGALLRARLTDPHGWLLSNTITSDTIAAMEEAFNATFGPLQRSPGSAIHPLSTSDYAAVLDLDSRVWNGQLWSAATYAKTLEASDQVALGFWRNGALLGMAFLSYVLDEGTLELIACHPEARRQGIGRSLLQSFSAIAEAKDLSTITLDVRADNLPAAKLPNWFWVGTKHVATRLLDAVNGTMKARSTPHCTH